MDSKICSHCQRTKSVEDFTRSARQPLGRHHTCRECKNQASREWRAIYRTPEVVFERNLLSRYGLTVSQYEEMLSDQGGGCALCHGVSPSGRRLAVDHNHNTGEVRGLLCAPCNAHLARVEDRDWLYRALVYLAGD